MDRFAVIGAPIAHSFSPSLHQAFAKAKGLTLEYTRILLDEARFEAQIQDFFVTGGKGLNITSPGKVRAYKLAKHHTARAREAKAANTLYLNAAGELCADNTDGVGLIRDLTKKNIPIKNQRILVLGAGGAAQGILPALQAAKPALIHVANRTLAKAQLLSTHGSTYEAMPTVFDVIIHATSAENLVLPKFDGTPICYDLSYHRSGQTPFTAFARKLGYLAFDGFGMLVEQAYEAFCVWQS